MMFRLFSINSIRSRMISGFLFLTLLIVILASFSLYLLTHTGHKARIHGHVSQLQIFALSLFKNDNDFFDIESTNEKFFQTHSSTFLVNRDSLWRHIKDEYNTLRGFTSDSKYLQNHLAAVDSALLIYNSKFNILDSLIYMRGFRDEGLEGSMRHFAHHLEFISPGKHNNVLLRLRRHEKDFLLRHDLMYVELFNLLADQFAKELNKEPGLNSERIRNLREYQRRFMMLVDLEKKIGLTSNDGLRNELNLLTININQRFLSLAENSFEVSNSARNQGLIFFCILLVIAIFFSIGSSIWISRRLSEPIARLSRIVREYKKGETAGAIIDDNLDRAANEIRELVSAFHQLIEDSDQQMYEIQHKSKQLKKKNFELKKLNDELDNFLYSTAHDLRSPLTSLLGLLNLLKYETNLENHRHYHHMMESSILRMDKFISQIVNYSKNTRLAVSTEFVDMRLLLDQIIEAHRFNEGSSTISWQLEVKDPVPVYSDTSRLTIIFNNLISNAIRYADPAKSDPYVKIQIRSEMSNIYIHFEDNGIGISQEHQTKIFDMFYRAHTSSKGSGLGLYILKQTIERMKGFVRVESKVNLGTRFFINLPNNRVFVPESEEAEKVLAYH